MQKYASLVITIAAVVLVVGSLVLLNNRSASQPGQYDVLAQCLTDKGVKFYGASWCPHCAEQKRLFGNSIKKVTYVECAVPGNQSAQTPACQEAKIESYPTWTFPDGSRLGGTQRLNVLADKAGCPLQ
jgi:glutaredoxin